MHKTFALKIMENKTQNTGEQWIGWRYTIIMKNKNEIPHNKLNKKINKTFHMTVKKGKSSNVFREH